MPLEDLLAKVKDEKREKELSLTEQHEKAVQEIKEEKKAEMEELKESLEREFEEKKENLLTKKEREIFFELKMERLQLKKELLQKAKQEVLSEIENLPTSKKKRIYSQNLEREKELLKEAREVVVPKGKKEKLKPVLKEAGIKMDPVEKDLDFKEGFLFQGERWQFEVTLEEILEREIEKSKKEFVNLLFEDL